MASASSWPTDDAPRCDLCGEPFGVYEPLVQVEGEQIRRTSRAASPELKCGHGVSCYHARCFEERQNPR